MGSVTDRAHAQATLMDTTIVATATARHGRAPSAPAASAFVPVLAGGIDGQG